MLIECEKGHEPTASRIKELLAASHELYICAVVVAEYYSGAPRGTNVRMDTFMDKLRYVDLTREMAATAGGFRNHAQDQGRRMATPDALVAALAHHLSATLVTNNIRDFSMTTVAVEQLGGTFTTTRPPEVQGD
ncbi:MAG: PIN domain-containing protein [Ardenticatenales bacterium]|nr:PIN domain-containing protein [Ardenticatenales bacterium]